MVKPQLNLDRKDDLKKPDGTPVNVFVTISEEPAPLNLEPVYAPPTARQGGRVFGCLCLALLFVSLFVLIFAFIGILPFLTHRVPPKPTGAPVRRFLEERLDINLELRIIRINRGEDDMFPAVDVLHDFNKNISAYSMPSSGVCYIQPLDMQSTLTPEGFQDLLDTEAYKDMDFPMNSKLYTVNPERATDLGDHIEEMCGEYNSYYISSVPSDQWPTFWTTARQVLRDHFGGRRGSSSSDGERRGGSGRHGSRGSSHSDEEGGRRSRGIARVRDYLDNMRSFDGQQVVDMHVFQTQNLDDLSPENLKKLSDLVEMEKEEDFMP